jgi:hypothetical protein
MRPVAGETTTDQHPGALLSALMIEGSLGVSTTEPAIDTAATFGPAQPLIRSMTYLFQYGVQHTSALPVPR